MNAWRPNREITQDNIPIPWPTPYRASQAEEPGGVLHLRTNNPSDKSRNVPARPYPHKKYLKGIPTLFALVLSLLTLIHCSPPIDSKDLEAIEEEPSLQTFSLESKGITLVYRDETGRTQWQLYADSAETTLSEESTYGTLRKVKLTLFRETAENGSKELPYAIITAESGWAHQAVGTFLLEGNVRARTLQGNFEITCQKLRGSPETGILEAERDVNARFGMWILGPLQTAKAQFGPLESSPKEILPAKPTPTFAYTGRQPSKRNTRAPALPQPLKLYNLVAKSQSTWSFRSTDGSVEITGIQEGSSELQKDGSLRVIGTGSVLRALWKQQNLVLSGSRVEGTLLPEDSPQSNTYRLESLQVSGGISGKWAGTSEGKQWTLDLTGTSATFSRPQNSLRVEGNVRINSNHPTLGGHLSAHSATLTLDEFSLAQNRYEPNGLLAEGNVSYEMNIQEDRKSRLTAKNFQHLTLKGKSTDETLFASGDGNPFDVALQSSGGSSATFRGHRFSATFSRRDAPQGQTWFLAQAHFTDGVEMTTSGTLARADGATRPWTVEISCPEIRYDESSSSMELMGGVKVEGNHPVIGLRGGVAEGPRMLVTFEKGTFDPIRVRWLGNPNNISNEGTPPRNKRGGRLATSTPRPRRGTLTFSPASKNIAAPSFPHKDSL